MVNYRRAYQKGGTYFFTVTLKNRNADYLTRHINALREAFSITKQRRPFEIIAIVVLPEHLHCIWTLPLGDDDYQGRWRMIKSQFTQALKQFDASIQKNKRGEYNLWQPRYWEHVIRDETDLLRHIEYIYFNPVKHGWAKSVGEWPFSSFHRDVNLGKIEADWGKVMSDDDGNYGE